MWYNGIMTNREKIIEILKRNDSPVSWWRGVPMSKFEEVADEIVALDRVDWAGLDPVKWGGIDEEEDS